MTVENFDRATRRTVDQYFGAELQELGEVDRHYEPTLIMFASDARNTFLALLDACNDAEVNVSRGRTPVITATRIRQLISEGLTN